MRRVVVCTLVIVALLLAAAVMADSKPGRLVKETKEFYTLTKDLRVDKGPLQSFEQAIRQTEEFPVRGMGREYQACPVVKVKRTRVYEKAAATSTRTRNLGGGWKLVTRYEEGSKRLVEVMEYYAFRYYKTVRYRVPVQKVITKTITVWETRERQEPRVEACYVVQWPQAVFQRGVPPGAPSP